MKNQIVIAATLAIAFGGWGSDGKLKFSREVIAVSDYSDASAKWCAFRDRENLGASESPIIVVIDTTSGDQLAKVSYNGRVWAQDGKEITF